MEKVNFLMPKKDLERMDELVKTGYYASKSAFLRQAVKKFLYTKRNRERWEETREVITKELEKIPEEKLKEELKEAHRKGRERVKRMLEEMES